MAHKRSRTYHYKDGKEVDERKLLQAAYRIATLYVDRPDIYLTLSQIATLVRISGFYQNVADAAVGRVLGKMNVERLIVNGRHLFRLSSVKGEDSPKQYILRKHENQSVEMNNDKL